MTSDTVPVYTRRMRLTGALLLFAMLLASCGAPAEPTPSPEPAPTKPVTTKEPEPAPAPIEDPQKKDPRYNGSRVYQLSELRVVDLEVGTHKFKAWVMDSPGKRQEGMMFLPSDGFAANEAMLFAFPEAQPLSFWMQNTPAPLDIAYVSKAKKLLNVQAGKPYDETPRPSTGDAQYVVEVKQGTFKRLGIKAGATVSFPADVVGR